MQIWHFDSFGLFLVLILPVDPFSIAWAQILLNQMPHPWQDSVKKKQPQILKKYFYTQFYYIKKVSPSYCQKNRGGKGRRTIKKNVSLKNRSTGEENIQTVVRILINCQKSQFICSKPIKIGGKNQPKSVYRVFI